jgi:hypothetical protein
MQKRLANKCLNQIAVAFTFLETCLNQKFENLPSWIWTYEKNEINTKEENKAIELTQYALADYHANNRLSHPS